MSKKILRITESQLKNVIGKIISEQTAPQAQGPQQSYKHSQTGDTYRLPQIKSDDDLSRFVNYGGDIMQKANLLASLGLDLRGLAREENQGIKKGGQPGASNQFLYIDDACVDFLYTVAKYNINPKNVKVMSNQILQLMDKKAIDKNYQRFLPMNFKPEQLGYTMDQFWDTMSKLASYQIKLIS